MKEKNKKFCINKWDRKKQLRTEAEKTRCIDRDREEKVSRPRVSKYGGKKYCTPVKTKRMFMSDDSCEKAMKRIFTRKNYLFSIGTFSHAHVYKVSQIYWTI